jgi:hypothetical protein
MVTWVPCPFRISKWQLVLKLPHGIDYLKKERNFLNKKNAIHVFLYCHACTCFEKINIVIFQSFIYKDVKPWLNFSCCIHYTFHNQRFLRFGNDVVNVVWTLLVKTWIHDCLPTWMPFRLSSMHDLHYNCFECMTFTSYHNFFGNCYNWPLCFRNFQTFYLFDAKI